MKMNNIHLSEEAQNDLIQIRAYIEEELLNPSAALATISKNTKSLRILRNYAQAGTPLSSVADIESDYRFIVGGNLNSNPKIASCSLKLVFHKFWAYSFVV